MISHEAHVISDVSRTPVAGAHCTQVHDWILDKASVCEFWMQTFSLSVLGYGIFTLTHGFAPTTNSGLLSNISVVARGPFYQLVCHDISKHTDFPFVSIQILQEWSLQKFSSMMNAFCWQRAHIINGIGFMIGSKWYKNREPIDFRRNLVIEWIPDQF